MKDRLVNTSVQILRLLPPGGLHTNEIIRQTSPDRTHIIETIRFLETGQLIEAKNEKNWTFGQKKTIAPNVLGFELRTLMEDLDRYNHAQSRFIQTMLKYRNLVGHVPQIAKNKDLIEVTDRRGDKHKVQDEAEADDLIIREERAIRSKLKSMGWTDNEIELTMYGDDVIYGLQRILYFSNYNILSALMHRYAFILSGFNIYNNDIARNILTEVIVSSLKKQLSNFIIGKDVGREDIDAIYVSMNDQIVYPILVNLERMFSLGGYSGPSKVIRFKVYHTLLLRFVSSDVKCIISSLLRIIHHYKKENVTASIDRARTEERAELMSRKDI